MNLSLLLQQLVGYCIASLITFLATRYHLTQEQTGLIVPDIYAVVGLAGSMAYGLWTHHRAFLASPPAKPT